MLQINSFDLYSVLVGVFGWSTLYFVLCLTNSRRSYEWHCRMVTVIHAITISSLAFYSIFFAGPWPFTHAGGPNTPLQVRTVTLCFSYFLFDFSWCIYHKTEGPLMMAHHFLSIIGLGWCLFAGRYGSELCATIGGAEVTNPLLQLRWFLRESGYRHSMWSYVAEWLFMLAFGFVRIVLGSALLYAYYQQDTDFWGRLGGTAIYSIGWFFFIGIVNYAFRKYLRIYRNWASQKSPESDTGAKRNGIQGGTRMQNGNGTVPVVDDGPISSQDADLKDLGVIREAEIPSPRELKEGQVPLTPRENLVVRDL